MQMVAGLSTGMNYLAADVSSFRSVAVYVMPPAVFAVCTDQVVSVVRRYGLGLQEDSAWAWLGRLVLAVARLAGTVPEVTPRPALATVPGSRERSPLTLEKQSAPVTPERLAEFYAADLAEGRAPSKRQIKRDWPVGLDAASDLHEDLAATVAGT